MHFLSEAEGLFLIRLIMRGMAPRDQREGEEMVRLEEGKYIIGFDDGY